MDHDMDHDKMKWEKTSMGKDKAHEMDHHMDNSMMKNMDTTRMNRFEVYAYGSKLLHLPPREEHPDSKLPAPKEGQPQDTAAQSQPINK